MNKSIGFDGLRIYGLLTDLVQFIFYSYDPIINQFCFDETIIINNKRIDAFSDMMDGPYFSLRQQLFRVDLLSQFPISCSVGIYRKFGHKYNNEPREGKTQQGWSVCNVSSTKYLLVGSPLGQQNVPSLN